MMMPTCFSLFLAVFYISSVHCLTDLPKPLPGTNTYQLRMPGVTPTKDDDYICSAFKVDPDQELFITQFRVEGTAGRAHHMTLTGCKEVPLEGVHNSSWTCFHHGACSIAPKSLFVWASNAPGTQLPPSVGFRIGSGVKSDVKYLVVQVHYAKKLPSEIRDYTGLDLEITSQQPRFVAGIWMMTAYPDIPPLQPVVNSDACCPVTMPTPIHVFAAMTHSHRLGKVITGYHYNTRTQSSELIIKGNPQWPQAFYPTTREFVLGDGDEVMIRCTYNSLERSTQTKFGGTANDEMCNVYFMYYSEDVDGYFYSACGFACNEQQTKAFPADSIQPLPYNPILEAYALYGNKNNSSQVPELIVQKINDENSTTNDDQPKGEALQTPMNLNRVHYKQVLEGAHHQEQPEAVQPETTPMESRPNDSSVKSVGQAKQRQIVDNNNIWSLLFFYRRFFS